MPTAKTVFRSVDAMDASALGALLADDARMVFANGEPLLGKAAIMAANDAFLAGIDGISHRLLNEWTVGPDTVAETAVTYTRLDGAQVTLPAVSIWRVGGDGLLTDYRVFVDLSPVFAPG